MSRLICILPVIMIFLSCKSQPGKHAAGENNLSILIFRDSAIVYNGLFDKNISYKKYLPTEFEKLGKAIEGHRVKYGSQSNILFKIASKDGTELSNLLQHINDISTQNNGPDLIIADVTEKEAQFFSIFPFKRSMLDSFSEPIALDLNMPRDYDSRSVTEITERHAFTCLVFSADSVYCYRGTNISSGAYYSLKNNNGFRARLKQIKKETGDSLVVILKPAETATYMNTVDILDEMTINNIQKYAMVKINEQEASFFNLSVPKTTRQHHVTPNTVASLPTDNAFLIEIREDNSVWYKILSPAPADSMFHKVKDPITSNLKAILSAYKAKSPDIKKNYLIKGDKKSTYPAFEQVINALKQNEIYKYNLVTSEDELSNQ